MSMNEINWKKLIKFVYKDPKLKNADGQKVYVIGFTTKGFSQETMLVPEKQLDAIKAVKIYHSKGRISGAGISKLPFEMQVAVKVNFRVQKVRMQPERRHTIHRSPKKASR